MLTKFELNPVRTQRRFKPSFIRWHRLSRRCIDVETTLCAYRKLLQHGLLAGI